MPPALFEMTPGNGCGKPIRRGDPRYRTAQGESHVRCHEGPRASSSLGILPWLLTTEQGTQARFCDNLVTDRVRLSR